MMGAFAFGAGQGHFGSWSGTLVTQEPLVHFDEARSDGGGNSLPFRRIPFMHAGRRYEVPVVSGNSIRGVWRRLLAGDLLSRVDLSVHELGPRVLYLLTSGGGLEGRDRVRRRQAGEVPPAPESVLKIGSKDELRAMLPMVSLLGASYGTSMVEGALRVGHAIPLCTATAPLAGTRSATAVCDLTGWTFQTRRDDRLTDEVDLGDRAKQQQIIRFEYLIAGVTLHHSLGLEAATDLEVSALARALDLFRARPFLGGKWATGNGRLSIQYEEVGDPGVYHEWVDTHREEVRRYLLDMEPVSRRKARR